MTTATSTQIALQNIRADVERELDYFTNPYKDEREDSLNELSQLILSTLDPEKGQEISSYGYRINRNIMHGDIFIVGRNQDDKYKLIRIFSVEGKWTTLTDVEFGPASEVFDYIMANWL